MIYCKVIDKMDLWMLAVPQMQDQCTERKANKQWCFPSRDSLCLFLCNILLAFLGSILQPRFSLLC